jgi:CheY-like chemotaxis protein
MSLGGLTSWQVRLAASAAEALDLIKAEMPDLILLDMMMPDTDGVTFYKDLQSTYGSECPPVIFMTAKVQLHEVEKYKTLGACGVIMKPFDPMTLPNEITQLAESYSAKS